MASFAFELVSPEKLVFSGDVDQVVVPGTEGDFGVLKDHSPVISALRPGIVTIMDGKSAPRALFVRGGFADVTANGLTILAELAIPVDEMTEAAFEGELKLASDELAASVTDESRRLAAERLAQIEALRTVVLH